MGLNGTFVEFLGLVAVCVSFVGACLGTSYTVARLRAALAVRRSLAGHQRDLLQMKDELAEVAEALGLRFGEDGYEGLRGARSVSLRLESGDGERKLVVLVSGLADSFWVSPVPHDAVTEVPTGDRDFDRLFQVQGDARQALAALNHRARALSRGLVEGLHFRTCLGTLTAEVPFDQADSGRMVAALEGVLALAEAMGTPEAIDERLLRSVVEDPVPAARAACLKVLMTSPQTDPVARRDAAVMATDAADARTRLAGALLAPGDRWAVLASIAGDPGVDPGLRSRALEALPDGLTRESLTPGRRRELARCVLQDVDVELRLVGARWVARGGAALDDAAERALVALLAIVDDADRLAVFDALARAGTIAAVEPLLPHTRRGLEGARCRQSARDAVDAIQARAAGEAGALTLTGDEQAGELSLARAAGAVSIVHGRS